MDFIKLLKELKKLKLPKDEFAVRSSGCLAVRGIREANDIDLVLSDKLWLKLAKTHKVEEGRFSPKMHLSKNVEATGLFKSEPYAKEQIETSDTIDGVRYVKLSIVKKAKRRYGRVKDKRDIKLIDSYLKRHKT